MLHAYSDESEQELDLDLPLITKAKAKKFGNRIHSSSSEGESQLIDSDLDSAISETSETATKTTKKQKKHQILSRDYIDNSDFDDNPLTLAELEAQQQEEEEKTRASKKTHKKDNDVGEFKKASEDFKSILKLVGEESEEESEKERSEKDIEIEKSNTKKLKKPKENLKSVLKESEALLRHLPPVELKIEVPKPKSLDLVLNEALAVNSRSSKEAQKRIVEEKRQIQRHKLERLLGKERLAELSRDEPKIGGTKLDEAVEVELSTRIEDEKDVDDGTERIAREIVRVKLVDLPDKHVNDQTISASGASVIAGYKAHIRTQKKASIELLNAQLQVKIQAQSNAALAHHQQLRASHAAIRRAKAEARERARRAKEVQSEQKLREQREKKIEGGELFKQTKEKYEGIERPVSTVRRFIVNDDENQNLNNNEIKPSRRVVRVFCDEDEDMNHEDLLNLENVVTDTESEYPTEEEDSDELPEMNEALGNNDSLSGLLSGIFANDDDASDTETIEDVTTPTTMRYDIQLPKAPKLRRQSEFIDDEASDEDEEAEGDDFVDEEALQEEMVKSKFIVAESEEESGDEEDSYDVRRLANEQRLREDEEMNRKYLDRYGGHVDKEKEGEGGLIGALGSKYGLTEMGRSGNSNTILKRAHGGEYNAELDEDIRVLLDPIEQKKRKLAALGSFNILQRKRHIEAASEEFQFKAAVNAVSSEPSSDYYASETETEYENDNDEDDYDLYEKVESGLQSRVEEMLDEEALDVEEVAVQATESLQIHLQTMSNVNVNVNVNSADYANNASVDTVVYTQSTQLTQPSQTQLTQPSQTQCTSHSQHSQGTPSSSVPRRIAVPMANAKLKSRLQALNQETDENAGNSNEKVFKGFTTVSKK